jgi:hypothetical protein
MLSRVRKSVPEHNAKETIAKGRAWFKTAPMWKKALATLILVPVSILLVLLLIRGLIWLLRRMHGKKKVHRHHHGKKRWYHHVHDHVTGNTSDNDAGPGMNERNLTVAQSNPPQNLNATA